MELLDNAMAHQQSARLEIVIVGAGIIGFAAAAALSRVGHRITVSKSGRNQEQVLIETQSSWKSRRLGEKQDSQLLLVQMGPRFWRH